MKKLGKILVGIVVALVVVLLAVVLTLPLTIGPAVKTAAKVGGPAALGVPVSVGDVKLRPLMGTLTISQVKIGNPEGYSKGDSFDVEKVEVGLNTRSLLSDTIVIKKIEIDAPAIAYEDKNGTSNFDAMMAKAKTNAEEQKAKKPEERRSSKKVVIEEFTLKSGKVSYSSGLTLGKPITLPLPSVTVRDIGKSSGGTTFAEAVTEVLNGILGGLSKAVAGAAGQAGDLLKGLGGTAGGAAKEATEALKGVTGGAKDAAGDAVKSAEEAAKGAKDAAKDAAKSLKKLFK